MNSNNESEESAGIFHELIRKFSYSGTLLEHWLHDFGLDYVLKLIDHLRKPMNSLWVQVNTNRIDFDSLLEIFDEREFIAKKHELFDDFIEVEVVNREFDDNLDDLPTVRVDHESSTGIALGKDVQTANVMRYDDFNSGDYVCVVDGASNVLAKGTSEVNSSEISTLTQRSIVRVEESLAYAPPLGEMSTYRRGFFSILSPIQVIGIKSMSLGMKDNILVMSNDKGDVASYIAELTQNKVPITVIAQNDMQVKAVNKTLERSKSKAIRVQKSSFSGFVNHRQETKYTSVYVEPQNSRTAVIPIFSSNLMYGKLRHFAENQNKLVSNLYRCLLKETEITYVTHSIDYLENEGVFKNALSKAYYNNSKLSEVVSRLKKQKKLTSREVPDLYEGVKDQLETSSIYFDPISNNNSGGFVSNFTLKEK